MCCRFNSLNCRLLTEEQITFNAIDQSEADSRIGKSRSTFGHSLLADLTNALNEFCSLFTFNKLNIHQQKAIELFVNGKKDIVVNL